MFTHYVRLSNTVLAKQACHCPAAKDHLPGEEVVRFPRPFYKSLRKKAS